MRKADRMQNGANMLKEMYVSVIVPIYNVEKYLDECLMHLERQTLKEIEIIMVNDGSTDNSPEIAQKYVDRNSNFRLINRENGGLSAARNTGMQYACGKYLYFLDSDDYLADTALYELFQIAEQNCLDVLKFSAYTFEENSTEFEWKCYKYKGNYNEIYTGVQLLKDVIENQDSIVSCCMIFMCRKLVEEYQLRFYEGIICEDNLFHWSLLAISQRVMVYNKPLYYRRSRSGSITQKANHYEIFRAFILSAKEADIFLEIHSGIKGTGIERYIYFFLMKTNETYRSLERRQRKTREIRSLYRMDRELLLKYRRFADISMILFAIHPNIAWLYTDSKRRAYKILYRIKEAYNVRNNRE